MESPPITNAVPAFALARLLGAKLVTNLADYWPRALVDMGAVRPGPALFLAEQLEAWMYRSCDMLTSQTQGIVDDVRRLFARCRR